jgi:hypothetical protein
LKIWRKFFSFEHAVADYPDEITTDFGEVVIPPPRQTSPGEKLSRRAKKRNKRNKRFENRREERDKKQSDVCADENESKPKLEIDKACSDKIDKIDEVIEPSHTEEIENLEIVAKKPRVRENPWNPMMPSFRVTCHRVGNNHNFDSMTAASNFGGAIYRYFGWNVKLTEFDIEVILGIDDNDVTVSLGLTKESLHRRNISHFGPTTLRPTIAYGMLR